MTLADWARQSARTVHEYPTRQALRHIGHELYLGGLRRLEPLFPPGVPVWDHEWDVLVVLDACRVDALRAVCRQGTAEWLPHPASIRTVRSAASTSDEWMAHHFGDEYAAQLARAGYLSGNGFSREHDPDRWGLYRYVGTEPVGDVDTVPPERLTDLAIDAWRRREEFDIDRLVVHYMQPHTPYPSRPDLFADYPSPPVSWDRGLIGLRDGDVGRKAFWRGYLDTLEWVLESVGVLQRNCEARIALTADHGEGFGEMGVYGHPAGIPFGPVRYVPYTTLRGIDTRTRTPETTVETVAESDPVADLKALGYR